MTRARQWVLTDVVGDVWLDQFGVSHNEPLHSGRDPGTRYDSLPADFSSSAQAWSPYLPFHSA